MKIGTIGGMLLATLLLLGCGGGMEVGGPGLSANDETFVQDDPLMGGEINEGTGSVIP
jgi:hypothetical protein